MRIKEVETLVGITKKNIRFYEKEGLLSPGRESENSYRDYGEEDVRRLRIIKLLRKISMPLSEIRDILDGRLALSTAARRHAISLDEQRSNIEKARCICDLLAEDNAVVGSLDVEAYLSRMEALEREGAIFMDVRQKDVKKKYVGPVVACFVIVAVMTALSTLLFVLNRTDPAPYGIAWIFIGVFFMVSIGTVVSLISRIKEIRGGEEDDLSQY